jgi:hypothetical protein
MLSIFNNLYADLFPKFPLLPDSSLLYKTDLLMDYIHSPVSSIENFGRASTSMWHLNGNTFWNNVWGFVWKSVDYYMAS